MIKVSPSILAADFGELRAQAQMVEKAGADMLHIDVMDGRYVPNITFGPDAVKMLKSSVSIPMDVHLMIENPIRYIDVFADAGADIITVHVEAETHIYKCLQQIKNRGLMAGVSLNPGTPASAVKNVLHLCDLVLVMTVNPGFTAQAFIPEMIGKVAEIRQMNPDIDVQVDGGIGPNNAMDVINAGATVIVSGAAVFRTEDPAAAISAIKSKKA